MSELKCLLCESTAMFTIKSKSIFDYSEDAFYIDAIFCHTHYCDELDRIRTEVRKAAPNYRGLSRNPSTKMVDNTNGTVTVVKDNSTLSDLADTILADVKKKEKEMKEAVVPVPTTDSTMLKTLEDVEKAVFSRKTEKKESRDAAVAQLREGDKNEKLKELMESVIVKKKEDTETEEEPVKMNVKIKMIKQKVFEDEVKHAILEAGINKTSYDVARYLHRPRGSVWNCIKRLGLQDKLVKKNGSTKRRSYNSLPEHQ